jgi:peroxiredoxin family protein
MHREQRLVAYAAVGERGERPALRTPGADCCEQADPGLRAKHEHVKVATVGNPGLHLATWAGGFPGVSALVTHKFAQEMEKLDIPPIPEFIEMISDTGAGLYACKASVDLFGLEKNDFIPQVQDIITVGEFYGLAGGGQIIFT